MGLREEHRTHTRRRILEAVLDLSAAAEPEELSVPAVSDRSGVSVATIYRYFPTKAALVDAAAWLPAEPAQDVRPARLTLDAFPAYLAALWRGFADNVALVRRQVASPAGREMRQARLAAGRAELARALDDEGIAADTPEGARLVSLCLLLGGSVAFLELHDRQGLGIDAAVDEACWAARVLADATRRELDTRPRRATRATRARKAGKAREEKR
jgi:AcrR family transcriptional regulator